MLIFVAMLGATGLMRLGEVVVSIRRVRSRPGSVVAEPWLFPLMVVLHAGLVFAPAIEVVVLRRPFLPWVAAGSIVTLSLATALRVWTLRTLGAAWNVRIVTPQSQAVVTGGPYAWIRHPNYLAVILEVVAVPLFHTAWLSALMLCALNGFVLFHRIRREETALSEIPAWRDAMADRPRLIPRIF